MTNGIMLAGPTIRSILVLAAVLSVADASAQIVTPQTTVITPDRFASLRDQLVNRLRATRQDQRDYIDLVVKRVKDGQLEMRLVVAVERYAMKRNPSFPFPFFDRALRFEAAKRGVTLPTVHEVASTATPFSPRL